MSEKATGPLEVQSPPYVPPADPGQLIHELISSGADLTEEQLSLMESIRDARDVQPTDYNSEPHLTDEQKRLDGLVVEAARRGRDDIALGLMTYSSGERRLEAVDDSDETWKLLVYEKGEELKHRLVGRFGKELMDRFFVDDARYLLAGTKNPEEGMAIPAKFWQRLKDNESELYGLASTIFGIGLPLDEAANALLALQSAGISSPDPALMRNYARMEEGQRQLFVDAYRELKDIGLDQYTITAFDDPREAIELALRMSGPSHFSNRQDKIYVQLSRLARFIPPSARPFVLTPGSAELLEHAANLRVESVQRSSDTLGRRALELSITDAENMMNAAKSLDTAWLLWHNIRFLTKKEPSALAELYEIMESTDEIDLDKLRLATSKTAMSAEVCNEERDYLSGLKNGQKPEPPLQEITPAARSFFAQLDVPPDFQDKLWNAWTSYSSLAEARFISGGGHKKPAEKLQDNYLVLGMRSKEKRMYEQASALQKYVELYGIDEAVELHQTFGIVNFVRGEPKQFHDMLARWKQDRPVKNIAAVATQDNNAAFSNEATLFFEEFGEQDSYYFEVSDRSGLAKVLVNVGDRERNLGRDPAALSAVENLFIGGHGEPEAIEFSMGNTLDVQSYLMAAAGRRKLNASGRQTAKPNDYTRHIGKRFKVTLSACSAAGKIRRRYNIAETISRAHSTDVYASDVQTINNKIIRKRNGSLMFPVSRRFATSSNKYRQAVNYRGRAAQRSRKLSPPPIARRPHRIRPSSRQ